MDILFYLAELVWNVGQLLWSVFVMAAGILCITNKNVRTAWFAFIGVVLEGLGVALHIHVYRDRNGWEPKNWGGIDCYQQTRTCRCGATKIKIRGTLPT